MTQELKACPHCGGPAEVRGHDAPERWINCVRNCQDASNNLPWLVEKWNTRPREDALEAENARLREALTDAYNCFRVYGEHMPEFMHGEPLKVHLKRYRTALGDTQ